MKKVELEKTRLTVANLAKLAEKGPVILTRKGQPLATVKVLSGSDWESLSLANNPRFVAMIEDSRRSYREEGGIALGAICRELGLTPKRGRRSGVKRNQTEMNDEKGKNRGVSP